jgi:hypothetical protein
MIADVGDIGSRAKKHIDEALVCAGLYRLTV